MVPLLAAAPQASLRAGRAPRDVPRRAAAPRRPGRGLGIDRRRSRACSRLQIAARQGRLRPRLLGGRRRADRRRPRAHRPPLRAGPDRGFLADPRDVNGLLHRRNPLPVADWRGLPFLLRLVRGPASSLTADLGRPDRCAGVRGLVELVLHDPLGLKHPPDPDSGRALHDRGSIQGPEGHRRLARLRRAHQVRGSLAPGHGRHRRRSGDGHGPRRTQGVPRRARGALLPRLRAPLHGHADARLAARARGRLVGRRYVPALGGPRRHRGERGVEDGRLGCESLRGRRPQRLDRFPLGRGERRALEPGPRRGRSCAHIARRPRGPGRGHPAVLRRRRDRGRNDDPQGCPRRAASAGGS